MAAFIIWAVMGVVFIGMGIYNITSKRSKAVAFGFWANAKTLPIKDVPAYNKALGKLWCVFGVVFIVLGLPLPVVEQNSPLVILPMLGAMAETIVAMAVYTVVIEKKYRK